MQVAEIAHNRRRRGSQQGLINGRQKHWQKNRKKDAQKGFSIYRLRHTFLIDNSLEHDNIHLRYS
ncbi:Uncharacterised protein [Vibrio cholerae]|nr:hypothetical protein VCHC56A1_1912 [Vibrio cholerae HC-56A1]EKG69594.1 hypothetical protein VCCP1040_1695 [Vibrio cholerae CP1040(13)]EKG79738.1 hypothetical protein VCCP1050_1690 [Vibrio cholerae CP1050(23)]CSA86494.1 Uncharacterised protein [Vibrio cholerae]CSB54672.1 Uncharacterised protein [Vibrio cholerae]